MASIESPPKTGSTSLRISNAVVHLMHEHTGRGPTKARTTVNDDLIVTVLQDNLTRGERSLVRHGRSDVVLSVRKHHQDAMRDVLVAAVEEHSGRDVAAFMSTNHIDPDYAVEVFVLAHNSKPSSDS
ncbi:MAG TPA: Na-translocating system protein MpsC family protein [Solirubrobacteraceae bacterium]|nr:Na-translocating system protein MpsC family protein [Solirubrobacteraceae bacterium]